MASSKRISLLLLAILPAAAMALETSVLEPVQDNTLYQTAADTGDQVLERSNGQGVYLFIGRVNVDGGFRLRRSVLQFNIAAALPAGARIVHAELTLNLSKAPSDTVFPLDINLQRLLAPWGEGASDAVGPEGQGIQPQQNDATWQHCFYGPDNPRVWQDDNGVLQPGGYFETTVSATATAGSIPGALTWKCTPQLLADVQLWLDDPAANHGWILSAGDNAPVGARRFDSRESLTPELRPQLLMVYLPAGAIFEDDFEAAVCP
jgi:hypothetical protein